MDKNIYKSKALKSDGRTTAWNEIITFNQMYFLSQTDLKLSSKLSIDEAHKLTNQFIKIFKVSL